jgi:hypothetical protein
MNGVLEIQRARQIAVTGTSTTSQAVKELSTNWKSSAPPITPMGDLTTDINDILSRMSSGQPSHKPEAYRRLLDAAAKEVRSRPAPDATWSQRIGGEITDAAD